MLGYTIGEALPDLRAEAESRMTSTCTIRERSTGTTTNPDTGAVVDVPGAVVYAGVCRLRPATLQAQSREIGGGEVFVSDVMLSVPVSVTGIGKGMAVTVDSSPDDALVGMRLEIQDVSRGDALTTRRVWCLEVS